MPPFSCSEAYENRGQAWYSEREYERAIAAFDEAIRLNPKSTTTYNKRVACDRLYGRNWSLALDAKIMAVTIPALLVSDNAC